MSDEHGSWGLMIDRLKVLGIGYTDRDLGRVAAAAAGRRLITELADSTASVEVLDEVARLVGQAADLLAGAPHERAYLGIAEGSINEGSDLSFTDYSPFVGPMNPLSPPIAVEVTDDAVVGRVTYSLAYEGPPGFVHGGFIAAGFDEILGFAQALSGQSGMTGRLEIKYRSPTPLRREVVYRAGIESVNGRKVACWGTLSAGDTLCAEATGLFISLDRSKLDAFMADRASKETPGG